MGLTFDEIMMQKCIDLARLGSGNVSPNPLVGCVITKDQTIISEGYHQFFGSSHAEANALNCLQQYSDLKDACLYVNLEPCSFFNGKKTPACVDHIIKSGIRRVVIGSLDPFMPMRGKSVQKLVDFGVDVKVGVLEDRCLDLNRVFNKFHTLNIPYLHLKVASTLDGKIAMNQKQIQISNQISNQYVHKLRNDFDSICIGRNTLNIDNPLLTVRIDGFKKLTQPYRIVVGDINLFNFNQHLFCDEFSYKTVIFTSRSALMQFTHLKEMEDKKISVYPVNSLLNGLFDWREILTQLAKLNITSVFLEGGSHLYKSAISQNVVDEISLFIAPKFFGSGVNWISDFELNGDVRYQIRESKIFDQDLYINYRKVKEQCLLDSFKM